MFHTNAAGGRGEIVKIICAGAAGKHSMHPLGPEIMVIKSRWLRFLVAGCLFSVAAVYALYATYIGKINIAEHYTWMNQLIQYLLFAAALFYGLHSLSMIANRIIIRERGFEYKRLFATESYDYMDVSFHLAETTKRVRYGKNFVSSFCLTKTVWVWQVLFYDGRKPLTFKSTDYSDLQHKAERLNACLTEIKYE